jgi:hypothetical protein
MLAVVADSLTVEYSKIPGKTFHRKVLVSTIFLIFVPCVFQGCAQPSGWPPNWRMSTKAHFGGVICPDKELAGTYDHRLRNTGHPVRSAIHKPQIGRLVVGWVTTSEYLLLYVFDFFADFFYPPGLIYFCISLLSFCLN